MNSVKRWRISVLAAVTPLVATIGLVVAPAGPAAATPDVQSFSGESARDAEPLKTAVAKCPAGKKVLGGGGRHFSGENGVALQMMYPYSSSTEDGYVASAVERADGYTGTWYVRAYVVCGNRPRNWEIVYSNSTFLPTGARSKQAIVRCSAGRQVIGTGGVVGDAHRGVSFSGILPTEDQVYVNGIEDPTDSFPTPNFGIAAWAVCADPLPGREVVWEYSTRNSSSGVGASASCPAGKNILGAGMNKLDNGQAHTYSMWPLLRIGDIDTLPRRLRPAGRGPGRSSTR